MGSATRPEVSAFERRALISLQYPSVAILGCSDSRVPIEIVFDHGLGDIFVIRVAGNCLDTTTTASLQYAINHLRVKVIVVMGHEGCGALKVPYPTLAPLPMHFCASTSHLSCVRLVRSAWSTCAMRENRLCLLPRVSSCSPLLSIPLRSLPTPTRRTGGKPPN
jgi:carbonic anhydrase